MTESFNTTSPRPRNARIVSPRNGHNAQETSTRTGAPVLAKPLSHPVAEPSVPLGKFAESLLRIAQWKMEDARQHALRVADMAERIAAGLGLAAPSRREIRVAALLHDIGKLALDNMILCKSLDAMTAEELSLFKTHSSLSAGAVEPLPGIKPVVDAVRHHHERHDGTGYPGSLSGNAIPLGARIIAVANAYDLMVSQVNGTPCTGAQAVQRILSESGKSFDPRVCETLARVVGNAQHTGIDRANPPSMPANVPPKGMFPQA